MGRLIVGVIVGYLLWTAFWLLGNAGLVLAFPEAQEAIGRGARTDNAAYLIGAVFLSLGCSYSAGRICGALATRSAKRATMIMGGLLFLTGIVVQAGVWDFMPIWYHLTFLSLLIPVCLIGGRHNNVEIPKEPHGNS